MFSRVYRKFKKYIHSNARAGQGESDGPVERHPLSADIEKNIQELHSIFDRCSDVVMREVSREIKKSVEDTIRLNQQEYQADIFGFGQRLYQKFPQVWKAIEKDWDDIYPTVEVSVKVSAMIRRTGMIGATPKIK